MITCSHCDAALPEGAEFCGKCGSVQPKVDDQTGSVQSNCTSCGNPLSGGAQFCGHCGSPQKQASVAQVSKASYCDKCGAAMEADDLFCGGCGSSANGQAPVYIQDSQVPAFEKRKMSFMASVSIGIVLAVLLIGGAYTLSSNFEQTVNSLILGVNSTKPVVSKFEKPPVTELRLTTDELNDFRSYVRVKERLNSDIINLANQVNDRINQTGNLRNSSDLRNRAQQLVREIEQYSGELANKNYSPQLQTAKPLLLQLFDLEMTRARSLLNGIIEGSNGQNYSSSFSVGTSAAYKFDEVNSNFILDNNALDGKVAR